MWVGKSCQNSQTLNSRFCKALALYGQVLLKTISQKVHCKQKSWNAYGTSIKQSSNKEYNNKA